MRGVRSTDVDARIVPESWIADGQTLGRVLVQTS